MKKNGFVFIESIVVLVIVVLSLTLLLSNYFLLVRNSKRNEYYNLPMDKYLLYTVTNLGESDRAFGVNTSFIVTKDNCDAKMGTRFKNCKNIFEKTNIKYYIVIYNLENELSNSNIINTGYDSPTIEYLKTLRRCKDSACIDKIGYVIGVFERNNKRYYASLEL